MNPNNNNNNHAGRSFIQAMRLGSGAPCTPVFCIHGLGDGRSPLVEQSQQPHLTMVQQQQQPQKPSIISGGAVPKKKKRGPVEHHQYWQQQPRQAHSTLTNQLDFPSSSENLKVNHEDQPQRGTKRARIQQQQQQPQQHHSTSNNIYPQATQHVGPNNQQ
jgi:hypothetical protein